MQFHPTELRGVVRIEIERRDDARGFFARTWCDREAAAQGLRTPMVQDSMAFNERRGTLRGLHYHASAYPQARVLSCVAGAVFVAVVDLRRAPAGLAPGPGRATRERLDTLTLALDAERRTALYVPPGLALGYQTLHDGTVVHYKMPEYYDPAHERGVRWNDPAFGIDWPHKAPILNARDAAYPDFDALAPGEP